MAPETRNNAKAFAVLFGLLGMAEIFAPGWNGLLAQASQVTPGESRIIASVYFVGAGLLWFR